MQVQYFCGWSHSVFFFAYGILILSYKKNYNLFRRFLPYRMSDDQWVKFTTQWVPLIGKDLVAGPDGDGGINWTPLIKIDRREVVIE